MINHGLLDRIDHEKWILDSDWTWLEYNFGGCDVGAQASQQRPKSSGATSL